MRPLIKVTGLTLGWDQTTLLEEVSFEVKRGSIFVIVGGSGCGKSTLLRYLIGLDRPMSGTIEIDGVTGAQLGVGRPEFGVMFQSGALLGSMTVGANLALQLTGWTALPAEAVNAIARAMVLEPSLIFLDEPSAGLDPISSFELDGLIRSLNQALGLTVVMVSHELQSIFGIMQEDKVLTDLAR